METTFVHASDKHRVIATQPSDELAWAGRARPTVARTVAPTCYPAGAQSAQRSAVTGSPAGTPFLAPRPATDAELARTPGDAFGTEVALDGMPADVRIVGGAVGNDGAVRRPGLPAWSPPV